MLYGVEKVKYIPQVMAMGTCPDEPRAFFMQQYRWCMGSTTLMCNKDFWRSNLTCMQKLCYISGMFYYSATAMVCMFADSSDFMSFLVWPLPDTAMSRLDSCLVGALPYTWCTLRETTIALVRS